MGANEKPKNKIMRDEKAVCMYMCVCKSVYMHRDECMYVCTHVEYLWVKRCLCVCAFFSVFLCFVCADDMFRVCR